MTFETPSMDSTPETLSLVDETPEAEEPSEISLLKEALRKAEDDLLRTLAELDNGRKRALREQEETRKYALTQFARDILSVLDNMGRAVSCFPETIDDPTIQTIREGVVLVQDEMVGLLARHQIQSVPALGEKFDPHVHQAIQEVFSPDQPPGHVLQVLQEGYTLSGRLLRPAMVIVSGVQPNAGEPA